VPKRQSPPRGWRAKRAPPTANANLHPPDGERQPRRRAAASNDASTVHPAPAMDERVQRGSMHDDDIAARRVVTRFLGNPSFFLGGGPFSWGRVFIF